MLDLLEKISAIFCGVVALGVAVAYGFVGTKSATPSEFLPGVVLEDVPAPTATAGAKGGKSAPGPAKAPSAAQRQTDDKLKKLLQKQGVKVSGPVPRKKAEIPASTFEFVQHPANWMKELKQYQSRIRRGVDGTHTRLELGGIGENSLLQKMGFQEGDVLELVDDQILEYGDESAMELRARAKDAMERLRRGDTIGVTISRGGKPTHIEFSVQ